MRTTGIFFLFFGGCGFLLRWVFERKGYRFGCIVEANGCTLSLLKIIHVCYNGERHLDFC